MLPVGYQSSHADVRFFHRLDKGLKHEKMTAAVCKVFKHFAFTAVCVAVGVVVLIGAVIASLPYVAIVAALATPILLGVFAGVADYSKKRERLARERLNNIHLIVEDANHLKELLNLERFPLYHFNFNDSDGRFMKRIGIISQRSLRRIKVINFVTHGRLSGCVGMIKRKIFNDDRWREVRVRLLNDLLLQEIIL
jgi:hypothetical protein